MLKIHKDVYIDGKRTQYILTDTGLLFNEITGKVSRGSRKQGYIYYLLTFENQLYNFAKHRLLAEYFIPNPENKPLVHHKDGNPLNNNLNNLQWVTYSENNRMVVNPIEQKNNMKFTETELETEQWLLFKEPYYISNLGRLKNEKTGKITTGSISKHSGYIRWNLNGHEVQAHRVVYQVFHPGEVIQFINHIDGIKNNNRIENLENVSQQVNVYKAFYETNKKKNYPTGQYNDQHELICTYPSMAEAARRVGAANTSVIRNAWLGNYKAQNYYWKVLSQEEYESALSNPNIKNILGKEIIDRVVSL